MEGVPHPDNGGGGYPHPADRWYPHLADGGTTARSELHLHQFSNELSLDLHKSGNELSLDLHKSDNELSLDLHNNKSPKWNSSLLDFFHFS